MAEIEAIEMNKKVASKESQKQMEAIENEIYRLRENGRADAHHYAIMKQIEAEQAQLTPAYLQKLAIESLMKNSKLYFGSSIPSYLGENLGELQKVFDSISISEQKAP